MGVSFIKHIEDKLKEINVSSWLFFYLSILYFWIKELQQQQQQDKNK